MHLHVLPIGRCNCGNVGYDIVSFAENPDDFSAAVVHALRGCHSGTAENGRMRAFWE
jgi:hypothetical protein